MFLDKSGKEMNLRPILLKICLFLSPIIIYLIYRILNSENKLIPLSVLAMISGAIIEDKRLTQKWSTVLYHALFSFVFSFLCFLPGKKESVYILENHIIFWPYTFLVIFVIFTICVNEDRIVSKLSEGITLIMSVALIYWIIGHGYHQSNSMFFKVIMIIVLLISSFSILNAFTKIRLTNTSRFILSIWSSIIMLLLAIEYVYGVFQSGQVEEFELLDDKLTVALQYFLLGVSSIYIIQNLFMLIMFFPSKGRFFNKAYFNDIAELKKDHLSRYSENQSSISLSIVCFIVSTSFFYLNYKFEFLSGGTAIWLAFFIMNSLIFYYENRNRKTDSNS